MGERSGEPTLYRVQTGPEIATFDQLAVCSFCGHRARFSETRDETSDRDIFVQGNDGSYICDVCVAESTALVAQKRSERQELRDHDWADPPQGGRQ